MSRLQVAPAHHGAASSRRDWLRTAAACALATQGPLALAQRTDSAATPFVWPDITLVNGTVISAASWQDTAAVLVFWATHCPFCVRHNAHVQKLHEAAKGQRLRVLTFSTDRDPATVLAYLKKNNYGFAVSMQDAESMRLRLGLRRTIPTTLGISRSGRLGLAVPGEMFEEDVLEMAALASRP